MKSKLKALLKSNRFCYLVYYYIGSAILKFVGLFIKTNPKQILFVSYGGKFTDSPVNIYNLLKKNNRFKDYELIWALTDPADFPQLNKSVKIDTPKFYIEAIKSGLWITNSSVSRGLNFKKSKTKYIMTEHGTAGIKTLGKDLNNTKKTFVNNFKENFDIIFIQGKEEENILSRAWDIDKNKFINTGLPRNDELVDADIKSIQQAKANLGVPKNKKTILYAPTFREQYRSKDNTNRFEIPFNYSLWKEELGENFSLIITNHYEIKQIVNQIPIDEFIINAIDFPNINTLLLAADVLISDYSSVVFDYSILEKPILCFAKDYNYYKKNRGFYKDPNLLFNHGLIEDENKLIEIIKTMDYKKECKYTKVNIKEKYITNIDGNATKRVISYIENNFCNEI